MIPLFRGILQKNEPKPRARQPKAGRRQRQQEFRDRSVTSRTSRVAAPPLMSGIASPDRFTEGKLPKQFCPIKALFHDVGASQCAPPEALQKLSETISTRSGCVAAAGSFSGLVRVRRQRFSDM